MTGETRAYNCMQRYPLAPLIEKVRLAEHEHSLAEIAERAGVARETLYRSDGYVTWGIADRLAASGGWNAWEVWGDDWLIPEGECGTDE